MDKGKQALQTATQKICDNYSITQFLQDNLSLVFPFWLNYEPSCQKVGTQIYAHLWQGPPPLDLAIRSYWLHYVHFGAFWQPT